VELKSYSLGFLETFAAVVESVAGGLPAVAVAAAIGILVEAVAVAAATVILVELVAVAAAIVILAELVTAPTEIVGETVTVADPTEIVGETVAVAAAIVIVVEPVVAATDSDVAAVSTGSCFAGCCGTDWAVRTLVAAWDRRLELQMEAVHWNIETHLNIAAWGSLKNLIWLTLGQVGRCPIEWGRFPLDRKFWISCKMDCCFVHTSHCLLCCCLEHHWPHHQLLLCY